MENIQSRFIYVTSCCDVEVFYIYIFLCIINICIYYYSRQSLKSGDCREDLFQLLLCQYFCAYW